MIEVLFHAVFVSENGKYVANMVMRGDQITYIAEDIVETIGKMEKNGWKLESYEFKTIKPDFLGGAK